MRGNGGGDESTEFGVTTTSCYLAVCCRQPAIGVRAAVETGDVIYVQLLRSNHVERRSEPLSRGAETPPFLWFGY